MNWGIRTMWGIVFMCLGVHGLPAQRPAEPRTPVLLVSVDGLHPSYVLEADRLGLRIPNLRRLLTSLGQIEVTVPRSRESGAPADVIGRYHRRSEELDDMRSGWRTATGSMPEFAYSGLWRGTQRYLGFTPTPTASATAVTLDSTILERVSPYGPAEGVEGTAASGSGTLAMVDASGQNFVELGVVPGMVIINISDSSKGTITTISTTNTLNDTINCSGGLSGGSANTWTLSDEFKVIGGSYGGFIEIGDTEASFLVGRYGGDVPFPKITMANGNVLFKAYLRPVLLANKNQYPELPPELHPAVGELAAGYLAGEFPTDTAEYKQSEMYIAKALQATILASSYLATQYRGGDQFLWSRRK
jgi:hypothetical protein